MHVADCRYANMTAGGGKTTSGGMGARTHTRLECAETTGGPVPEHNLGRFICLDTGQNDDLGEQFADGIRMRSPINSRIICGLPSSSAAEASDQCRKLTEPGFFRATCAKQLLAMLRNLTVYLPSLHVFVFGNVKAQTKLI